MARKPLTIQQYRQKINEGDITDPLMFLEAIQSGQDPRHISQLYELVRTITDFTDGNPSPEDWEEVVCLISEEFRYRAVSIGESIGAAKTMAEYLHPKRKQVEKIGPGNGETQGARCITLDEVKTVEQVFNDEF